MTRAGHILDLPARRAGNVLHFVSIVVCYRACLSTTGLTYLLPSNKNAPSQCAASAPRSSVSHEPVLRGMMLNENRLIIHEHAHHCNTTPSPRPSVYETIERMGLVLDSGGGLQNQQHISTELCVVSPRRVLLEPLRLTIVMSG